MDIEQLSIEEHYLQKLIEDNSLELLPKFHLESDCSKCRTPLIQALQNDDIETVKLLLKNRADTSLESCEFGAALDVALIKMVPSIT